MRKLTMFLAFILATGSLFAQKSFDNQRSIDNLAKRIHSVTKRNLSDVEQQKQIANIVSDFLSNDPAATYKMKQKNLAQKLATAKKEKPVSDAKVKEFIKHQKAAYSVIGNREAFSKPKSRGGNEVQTVQTSTEAINTYCAWELTAGEDYSTLPGHCILTPIGLNAYNLDAQVINQSLGPGSNNAVLIPTIGSVYTWEYTTWQDVNITGL